MKNKVKQRNKCCTNKLFKKKAGIMKTKLVIGWVGGWMYGLVGSEVCLRDKTQNKT